jgi:hypothetical protein
MRFRHLSLAAVVPVVLWLAPAQPAGQAPDPASSRQASASWVPPRTPDGQPDIQGIWANYDPTPFETPLASDPRGVNDGTGPSADFNDTVPRRNARRRSMVVDRRADGCP